MTWLNLCLGNQSRMFLRIVPSQVDTTAAQGVAASTRQAVGQVVVQARGPGRPRGRGRPPTKGLPTVAAHPAVRRGRRGRPPKLGGGVASVEQQAQRRKARLKEVHQIRSQNTFNKRLLLGMFLHEVKNKC